MWSHTGVRLGTWSDIEPKKWKFYPHFYFEWSVPIPLLIYNEMDFVDLVTDRVSFERFTVDVDGNKNNKKVSTLFCLLLFSQLM